MVCILLENREDNHLQNYQDILKSFFNVLHIQPKMMRPNDARRNKHIKHYALHMVKDGIYEQVTASVRY
jgi:hypothetical protein